MIHDGEKEVVRRQPFAHVKMALAANHATSEDYPRFDPLAIFSTNGKDAASAPRMGTIYGSAIGAVLFLVAGEGKREALNRWQAGVDLPARAIMPPGGVDVFTEKALLA